MKVRVRMRVRVRIRLAVEPRCLDARLERPGEHLVARLARAQREAAHVSEQPAHQPLEHTHLVIRVGVRVRIRVRVRVRVRVRLP